MGNSENVCVFGSIKRIGSDEGESSYSLTGVQQDSFSTKCYFEERVWIDSREVKRKSLVPLSILPVSRASMSIITIPNIGFL